MPPTSPFRGGLYSSSFCSCTMLFLSFPVGTGCAVSVDFGKGKSRWKRSTGTFPKSHNSKRQTGRSGLVRSALEKLSLFSPTFSVRQKHGAGNFAVCGQRLRGHVPSKNTSPAALSWSSLIRKAMKIIFVLPHVFSIISRRDRLCRVRSAASFPLIPAKPHQKRALHFEVLSQNHTEQRSFYASSCADSRKIAGSYSIWFLS